MPCLSALRVSTCSAILCALVACQSQPPKVKRVPVKPKNVVVETRRVPAKVAITVAPASPASAVQKGAVKAGGAGKGGASEGGKPGGPQQPAVVGGAQSPQKPVPTAPAKPAAPQPKVALATPALATPTASPPPKVAPPKPDHEAARRRELAAADAAAKKALDAVPEEVPIPEKATVKVPDNAQLRETWNALQGEWEQSEGEHAADCVEGGYTERTLTFGKNGILTIRQQHGPKRTLTRTMDFTVQPEGKIQLGKERKPDAFLLAPKRQVVRGETKEYEILPPATDFPATFSVDVSEGKTSLTLDGKVYRKVK